MRRLLTMLFVVVMVVGLMTSEVMAASAPQLIAKPIDYVAFGDSIAAGVRGGTGLPGSEAKSDKGYTDAIANMLKDKGVLRSFNKGFIDSNRVNKFCSSGMTAATLAKNSDVLNTPAAAEWHLVKDAEIVTIDIGANDLLGPLYTCIDNFSDSQQMILIKIITYMTENPSADITAALNQLNPTEMLDFQSMLSSIGVAISSCSQNINLNGLKVQGDIETILQNILKANKNARIYVMGYYNPLPALSTVFGIDLKSSVGALNHLINNAIKRVRNNNKNVSIIYVDTMNVMSSSNHYLVPTDIHPTEAGHQAIAGEFYKLIKEIIR